MITGGPGVWVISTGGPGLGVGAGVGVGVSVAGVGVAEGIVAFGSGVRVAAWTATTVTRPELTARCPSGFVTSTLYCAGLISAGITAVMVPALTQVEWIARTVPPKETKAPSRNPRPPISRMTVRPGTIVVGVTD
jgi:hypothetical protein